MAGRAVWTPQGGLAQEGRPSLSRQLVVVRDLPSLISWNPAPGDPARVWRVFINEAACEEKRIALPDAAGGLAGGGVLGASPQQLMASV